MSSAIKARGAVQSFGVVVKERKQSDMDSARLGGSGRADSSPCRSRENGNPGGPTKDRVTQTRRMRTIPTCHSTNLSLRRSLPPRRRGAAIQRASVGDRLSLSPGCTPDRTLPADATGLDSGLRRNDMGRGHMGT